MDKYLEELREEAELRGIDIPNKPYTKPNILSPIEEEELQRELLVRDEVKRYTGVRYQGIPLSQYRTGSLKENTLSEKDIEDITNKLVGQQEKRIESDSFLQKARKVGANTVRGLQKFGIELGLGAFSDPVKTAKSVVDFFPDIIATVDKALATPGEEPTIQGIPRSQWTGKKITYSKEEVEQAKDQLFERPDALLLAGLPLLKIRGGEAVKSTPKVEVPRVEAVRITEAPVEIAKPKLETTKPVEQVIAEKKPQTDLFEYSDKKDVGLKNQEIEFIRESTGLKELPAPERKSFEMILDDAKKQNLQTKALDVAENVIETKRAMTDTEHAAMTIKAAELSIEYDRALKNFEKAMAEGNEVKAEFERSNSESILSNIDRLTEASRLSGTEAGRALSVRRMFINREDFSLSGITRRVMAKKGGRLTEAESAKVREYADRYAESERKLKELEAINDELVSRIEKQQAEEVLGGYTDRQVKRTAKKQRSIANERAAIKKQLRDLGFRVNDITGATSEGSILIGKLALSYIKEGINTLDGVVKAVKKDMPGVTESDVYRGLSIKNKRRVQKAVNRAKETEIELKKQAKLKLEIESLEKGLEPQKGKSTRKPDSKIVSELKSKVKELRKGIRKTAKNGVEYERYLEKLKSLEDQLDNLYRPIKNKKIINYSDEVIAVKEKLKEVRELLRIQDKMADINEQLRTGEFKNVLRVEREVSPELSRARAELNLARREIRYYIETKQPWTPKRIATEMVNTLRTLKATADVSATLRQGGIPFAKNLPSFPKRFGRSVKGAISETYAEAAYQKIINDPLYYKADAAGLHITEQRGAMNMREENFMSNLVDKVPVIKNVTAASERNMVFYLNELRWKMFTDFLENNPNATRAELRGWADFVNKATGRGDLGRLSGAANLLSLGFFAPRFFVSRFQAPVALLKNLDKPIVAKEIGKNLASAGALAMSALYLAELNGAEVGKDPREADFGKIRYGDTRFDIFAGEQQPLRFIVRIGLAVSDRAGITGKEMLDREKEFQLVDELSKFLSYKVAPSLSLTSEIIAGKTIVGEERDIDETLINAAIPMIVESTIDAYKRDGGKMAAAVAGAEFFGIGASTYEESETKIRKEIRELIDNELYEEATKLKLKWNNEHPNRKIKDVSSTLELLYNESMRKVEESFYEHGDTLKLQDDIKNVIEYFKPKFKEKYGTFDGRGD